MMGRRAILDAHVLKLPDIQAKHATLSPLDGAKAFLEELRSITQVIILNDTFEEFAQPLMRQLGWPTIFCHRLVIEGGRVAGYTLRQPNQKQRSVEALRGLNYLVSQSETGTSLKIRVLNATKRELSKDLEKAVEFDQSTLFKKVYEEEYGTLGGEPYGMLMGDYEFGRSAEDVSMLEKMSNLAASAHAPFVSSSGS